LSSNRLKSKLVETTTNLRKANQEIDRLTKRNGELKSVNSTLLLRLREAPAEGFCE